MFLPIKKFLKTKKLSANENDEFSEAKSSKGCNVSVAVDGESSQAWTKAPFFSSQVRDSVSLSKCSDEEINKKSSLSFLELK